MPWQKMYLFRLPKDFIGTRFSYSFCLGSVSLPRRLLDSLPFSYCSDSNRGLLDVAKEAREGQLLLHFGNLPSPGSFFTMKDMKNIYLKHINSFENTLCRSFFTFALCEFLSLFFYIIDFFDPWKTCVHDYNTQYMKFLSCVTIFIST